MWIIFSSRFFPGVAGTYAFYSPKIHEAVAGIAISVAVIPPVVMLGVGLGIGIAIQNTDLVTVSATIVLGNVIGIYLGAIVMIAGLHRISRDRVAKIRNSCSAAFGLPLLIDYAGSIQR